MALWQLSAQGVPPFPAEVASGNPDVVRFLRDHGVRPAALGAPAGHPGFDRSIPAPMGKIAPRPEDHYWLPGWAFGLSPRMHTLPGEHR